MCLKKSYPPWNSVFTFGKETPGFRTVLLGVPEVCSFPLREGGAKLGSRGDWVATAYLSLSHLLYFSNQGSRYDSIGKGILLLKGTLETTFLNDGGYQVFSIYLPVGLSHTLLPTIRNRTTR